MSIGLLARDAVLDAAGVTRVVVVAKEDAPSGERVSVALRCRARACGAWAAAEVVRLEAPEGALDARDGVTWAGQTFDGTVDGAPSGERTSEPLEITSRGGWQAVEFTVAAASVALVEITPAKAK